MREKSSARRVHICGSCKKAFDSEQDLSAHAMSHVSGKTPKSPEIKRESFICDDCFLVCYSHSDLARHKQTHDGKIDFRCDICGEVFLRESGMRRHFRHVHPDEEVPLTVVAPRAKSLKDFIGDKQPLVMLGERVTEGTSQELLQEIDTVLVETEAKLESDEEMEATRTSNASGINNSRFKCRICDALFDSTDDVMQHVQVHAKSTTSKNNVSSDDKSDVEKESPSKIHEESDSTENEYTKIFTCQECFNEFHSKANLLKHMTFHKSESTLADNIPEIGEDSDGKNVGDSDEQKEKDKSLEKISGTEDESLADVVDECIKESALEKGSDPKKDAQEKGVQVDVADEEEDTESVRHAVIGAEARLSTKMKKNLKDIIGRSIFPCGICVRVFDHENELERHIKSEHFVKLLGCRICGGEFTRRSNLTRHFKATHKEEGSFECAACSQRFSIKYDLLQHELSHQSEIEKEKDSSKSTVAIMQKKTHSKSEAMIYCKDCDEVFVLKKDLKQHRREVHKQVSLITNEPPVVIQDMVIKGEGRAVNIFRCNLCPKFFNLKSDLMRHFLIHSGAKPFTCDICGNKFNRKSNLVRHKRLMHHTLDLTSTRNVRKKREWDDMEEEGNRKVAKVVKRKQHLKKEIWEIEDEKFAEEERILLEKLLKDREAEWERLEKERIEKEAEEYYEVEDDDDDVDNAEAMADGDQSEMELTVIEPGDQITVRILTY